MLSSGPRGIVPQARGVWRNESTPVLLRLPLVLAVFAAKVIINTVAYLAAIVSLFTLLPMGVFARLWPARHELPDQEDGLKGAREIKHLLFYIPKGMIMVLLWPVLAVTSVLPFIAASARWLGSLLSSTLDACCGFLTFSDPLGAWSLRNIAWQDIYGYHGYPDRLDVNFAANSVAESIPLFGKPAYGGIDTPWSIVPPSTELSEVTASNDITGGLMVGRGGACCSAGR
ncbi:MAG: hypothetical protein ACTJLL_02585 [Anaplasma sp.]